jgi:hypothetical protein
VSLDNHNLSEDPVVMGVLYRAFVLRRHHPVVDHPGKLNEA